MKEVWIPGRRETKSSEKTWLKQVRQKYAVRAAVLFAIAFPGCSIFDHQEPAPTMTPLPTPAVYQLPPSATFKSTEAPTPIPTPTPTKTPVPTRAPEPTPTIIPTATPRPTETPRPTPTLTPEPTPTKTPVPTKTPRPPPTPRPTPKPKPTPSPTPWFKTVVGEVPKTYVKPGQKLVELARRIENPSSVSKLRSADLEFQVEPGSLRNERNSVKTEFRIPLDSEKSTSEGTVFSVLPDGTTVRIIVDVPPGASPGCFKDIIFSLKTREPGASGGEIERVSLAKNVCVEETLTTYFTGLYYDEGTKRVVGDIVLISSAPVGQMAELKIANCTFKIAEKEVERETETRLERLDLNKSIAFRANSERTYKVYLTPEVDKTGKKPSDPFGCTANPKREFGKQIPEPKPK